jgi:NADH-quinone oxidoreductase subunit L
VAGVINLPFASRLKVLEHWLEPSLFGHESQVTVAAGLKWGLAVIALVVALTAIVASFRVYLRGRGDPAAIERPVLANAWYVDATYASFMGGPGRKLFDGLAWFDRTVIDGTVRGIARALSSAGRGSSSVLQPGFVRYYALTITAGGAAVMIWFLGRLWAS